MRVMLTGLCVVFSQMFNASGVETEWEQNPLSHGEVRQARVDFTRLGTSVRALNGINEGPSAKTARAQQIEDFKALNSMFVRLHDIPLANPGCKLVDVQDIFPIWNPNADPADPNNYFFDQTDDYLKTLADCGVKKVLYRLGTSIEWTKPRQHFAKYPKNPNQYAEVCAAIVRHYTRGWANGFDKSTLALDFEWEIWNEPNLKGAMFDRPIEEYFELYARISKRLHLEFPEIKTGGPALTGLDLSLSKAFLDACRKAGAPVNFYSWHSYIRTPMGGFYALDRIREWRDWLNKNGWKHVKLYFTEWNYFPCTWTDVSPAAKKRWRRGTADGKHGVDAAAFITLCLTRWQDLPLDESYLYMFQLPDWGLYSPEGEKYPAYWGLKLFGDFLRGNPVRATVEDDGTYAILAGVTKDGQRKLLVSDFRPMDRSFEMSRVIAVTGIPDEGNVRLTFLDGTPGEPRVSTVLYKDGVVILPPKAVSGSAVYLVEFIDR